MSKIYLELLDKQRQIVFQRLSHFKESGYLAGGTALALQIKHRKSYDFDVFTYKAITPQFRTKVENVFGKNDYYVHTGDQISFNTKENIGVTFVHYYYKQLFPLVKTQSIALAHYLDIAADKAHTIGRRAVWRDYVDFYFLLKFKVVDLSRIIQLAEKKFEGEFIKTQFLEQLVYFKDLSVLPMTYVSKEPSSTIIQSFLEHEVEQYLKKVLG